MQALRHEGIAALVQWSDACPTLTKEAAGSVGVMEFPIQGFIPTQLACEVAIGKGWG
jgi:hypothetical protein